MRANGVVMPSPALDDHLGLLQRVKNFTVEQFVAELRVEAFTVAVLPWTAWLDVGGLGSNGCNPLAEGLGDELRAIVGTNVPRDSAQDEQVREHVDHIGRSELSVHSDRQAFPRELVDDVEHAILLSIMGAILDEVVGPDMVGIFRPQPDARSVIEPEPASLRLLLRNLQPLPPPDPLDPFDVHHPAGIPQHGCDPPIAITAVLGGERDDAGGQGRFIIRDRRNLALCGSMLTKNPARKAL